MNEAGVKVWGRTNSVNVQKVLWCLAEVGASFEQIDAGLQHGINDTEWFLRLNPNGKVPLIKHGALTLWESNTIVRYLSATFDPGGIYPESPVQRARAEQWMDWQLSVLARPHSIAFWNLVRTPPDRRDMDAVARNVAKTNRALGILDDHLTRHDYVAGSAFSMGDIPVGAIAHRWLMLVGIDRPEWPALRRWFDRLRTRPGFRRHVMLPLS